MHGFDSGSTSDSFAGSYENFKAEGDVLFKQGNPKKALNSYCKALDIKPGDRTCLVARSQCYLQLGDSELALIDAEATLDDDPENTKGLLQKAEALYCKGDFEYALVFYHRGNKLRPEVQAFRLGIQKSQEAIENCIGKEASIQLENKGDLSYFYKQDEKVSKKEEKKGYNKPAVIKKEERPHRRPHSYKDKKTIKQLLGELYADRDYLEQLLEETESASNNSETNMSIRDLAIEGLEYLDTRTDFWQQQKPMYSRKRDGEMRQGARSRAGTGSRDPTAFILRALEEIDEAQAQGKFEASLKLAKKTMKTIDRWSDSDLPNRPEFVANIHSVMGNAYLEMADYPKALEHHNVDREIASQQNIEECKSRALDNLGRVYARMGKFDKALEFWEEKLPISKSALERTWLYHEIGRCYLEQGKYQTARDNGEKSLKEAEEAGDDVWQLNASVLVTQAEMKLGDYQAALDYFERSLEMAKVQNDKMAEKAIQHAIEDANRKIVKSIKAGSKDGRSSTSAKSEQTSSDRDNKSKKSESQEKVKDREKVKKKKQETRSNMSDNPSTKSDREKEEAISKKSESKLTKAEKPSQKNDAAQRKSETQSKKTDAPPKKSDTKSKKSESQSQKSEAKAQKTEPKSLKSEKKSKQEETPPKKSDPTSKKSESGSQKSKKGSKGIKNDGKKKKKTAKAEKISSAQEEEGADVQDEATKDEPAENDSEEEEEASVDENKDSETEKTEEETKDNKDEPA